MVEGGHAVVLEGLPDVVGEGLRLEEPVVEGDVGDLELDGCRTRRLA